MLSILRRTFEVSNPAILKDRAWIADVAELFSPNAKLLQTTKAYTAANPVVDEETIFAALEKLRKIINNHVGVIDLTEDLDIETVTEIFIRVNSAGATLGQADFAMSKIAADERHGGSLLRKAIDYFCHLAVAPEFLGRIEKGDPAFAASEFLPKIRWLADATVDIYDPSYTDMLRVAFTSQFRRGRLQDLVALLSGRNFETKQYEETIAEESFARLKHGVLDFINKTHFDRITMILRSAGFVTSDLIRSQNAVNFAYILYLHGRGEGIRPADLERLVRRWYVMSVLRVRYGGSPETVFDFDIRQIDSRGLVAYAEAVIEAELPGNFWSTLLPQELDTSSVTSPYFLVYQAAQAKIGDKGFLSRDITVRDLLLNRSDVHHIYPRNHLKKLGLPRSLYNQIANFALAQSEINIAIGDKSPEVYFKELGEQSHGGKKRYGGITNKTEMLENFRMSCIPEAFINGEIPVYRDFLERRRKLMAQKIKAYFDEL